MKCSHQDAALGAKRIVYAYAQTAEGLGPVTSTKSPDIACNAQAKTPALIAPARAGSNLTFSWNSWIINHKGPVITVSLLVFLSLCGKLTLT